MILEGLILMVVGMLVVYLFLIVMVMTMHGAATFFQTFAHWFPEPEPVKVAGKKTGSAAPVSDDAEIALAIAAAKAFKH